MEKKLIWIDTITPNPRSTTMRELIEILPEHDNEEEYILLELSNYIDGVDILNKNSTKETHKSVRFMSRRHNDETNEKLKVFIKLVLKSSITASLMNQYLIEENLEKAQKCYKKYLEILGDCDEHLSSNYSSYDYVNMINELNDVRKLYEELIEKNKNKKIYKEIVKHLMTNESAYFEI